TTRRNRQCPWSPRNGPACRACRDPYKDSRLSWRTGSSCTHDTRSVILTGNGSCGRGLATHHLRRRHAWLHSRKRDWKSAGRRLSRSQRLAIVVGHSDVFARGVLNRKMSAAAPAKRLEGRNNETRETTS